MHKNSHTQPVDFNPLLQVCANYSDGLLGHAPFSGTNCCAITGLRIQFSFS
jgi:hypothetical protein